MEPVPNNVPPVAKLYQFTAPPELVAPSVTVEFPQAVAGVLAVIEGFAVTVTIIGFVK